MTREIQVIKETEILNQPFLVYGTYEEPLFKAMDVAEILEIKNARDMVTRVDEDEVRRLNLRGRSGETLFLTEAGLYEVMMQSRKPIAKTFKKQVKKVLHELRVHGRYEAFPDEKPAVTKENVESRILLVDAYERLLHINDTSKAMMLNSIAQDLGAPLLDYVPSKGVTHSATYLLKANGIDMSAQKFNKLMLDKGVLVRNSRPSKGQTSPQNPKETQPCWYDNTFTNLFNN